MPETTEFSLPQVSEHLKSQLDNLVDELDDAVDDYKKLFNYFVASKFEGITPAQLRVCDRSNDQKIDFYFADDDQFVAYQCKLGEFETHESVISYGDEIVNEIEDIFTFVTDESGRSSGNKCAQEARNIYRQRKSAFEQLNGETSGETRTQFKLKICLAIYGLLSPGAIKRLDEFKITHGGGFNDLEIEIIDFETIRTELTLPFAKRDRPEKIKIKYVGDVFSSTNNWGYALVQANSFVELFKKHGMALFDLNVRYYLEKSSVNKQIKRTLSQSKGIDNFHLLNNGITISCTSWEKPKPTSGKDYFVLHNPQIINGCQTVISVCRAAAEYSEEYLRRKFESDCKVPVRIVLAQNEQLLDDIVTASNNQNKMSARNLRSNSTVQRMLQRNFEHRQRIKWFYERKDGEFESLKTTQDRNRNFKAKDFEYRPGRYRKVGNEDLAKTWLSFIGFSKDGSENIKAFDFEEQENPERGAISRYEWLFELRPLDSHWEKIALGPQVKFNLDNFESGAPTPEHYLLSYLLYEFTKAYLPSPQANKTRCLDKLRSTEKITASTSAEETNKYLAEDTDYVENQVLYNMKEVIVELFAMILVKTYGGLNEETVKRILALECFDSLYACPDFKGYVKELDTLDEGKKISNVLFSGFGFIREAIRRWLSVNKQRYLSNQRRIRFLHSSATIEEFKDELIKTNADTKAFGYPWKGQDVEFFESLPKLS